MDPLIEALRFLALLIVWILLAAYVPVMANAIGRCPSCGRMRRRRELFSEIAGEDYHDLLDSAAQHGLNGVLVDGLKEEIEPVGWRWLRLYAAECRWCRVHWLQAGRQKRGVQLVPLPDERRHSPRIITGKQVEILRWAIKAYYLERNLASHRRSQPWTAADNERARQAVLEIRGQSMAKSKESGMLDQSQESQKSGDAVEWDCVAPRRASEHGADQDRTRDARPRRFPSPARSRVMTWHD